MSDRVATIKNHDMSESKQKFSKQLLYLAMQ